MDKRASQLLLLAGGAALAIYVVTRSARAATEAIVSGDRDETGSRRGGVLPRVGEMIGGEDQFSETVEQVQLPRGGGSLRLLLRSAARTLSTSWLARSSTLPKVAA